LWCETTTARSRQQGAGGDSLIPGRARGSSDDEADQDRDHDDHDEDLDEGEV
jgi:hypothetical protein